MQNRNLENLIPIALEVLEEHKSSLTKESNGHFSSFGPSVIMAGLHQTVISYEDKKGYVNNIILKVYNKKYNTNHSSLSNLVTTNSLIVKNQILDIVIACKLAIRTIALSE